MGRWLQRNFTLVMLLTCGFAIALGGYAILRANNAITEACTVQARGLKANQHLQQFFIDYAGLLRLDTGKTAKALLKEPKAQRLLTIDAIAQISAYAAISAAQPKHRSCP